MFFTVYIEAVDLRDPIVMISYFGALRSSSCFEIASMELIFIPGRGIYRYMYVYVHIYAPIHMYGACARIDSEMIV